MVQLAANVPVYRCEACDFEYLDYEAEQRKQEAVCRYLGVLTPGEIKQIRNGFAMTRAEFSKITGIGPASLNRWENGLSIQTLAYDRYLRLLGSLRNRRILEMFFVGVGFQNGVALENRFRAITVTECLKKEQSSFQLCKVA